MTRREKLDEIFKDVETNKKELINPLLDDIAFLEERMEELKKMPFIRIHPKDPTKQKVTKAAKLYKEHSQSYMNAIRMVYSMINGHEIEEDPVQSFWSKEKNMEEVNYLKEYYSEIQKGNIIVGLELKTELQKLIRDLDDPRYRYDLEESHLRIEFMENLCLQSKKPFYNMPMQLLLWEKAFIETIYSFKVYDEELKRWVRRFQNILLLIARKNGKTTLMAADAHTDLRIGEGGMDIVCASNDDKQASLLWNEVDNMRKRIDPHSKITHKNMSQICNTKKNITIFKMSSKTQNKDGRNIDKMYMDESHDAPNDEIAEAGQKSMSTKDEPLFINLTTEGFINDGYLDHELVYAREVIFDETDDIHYLPWLYTQDSEEEIWQDEQSWYKSNPRFRSSEEMEITTNRN